MSSPAAGRSATTGSRPYRPASRRSADRSSARSSVTSQASGRTAGSAPGPPSMTTRRRAARTSRPAGGYRGELIAPTPSRVSRSTAPLYGRSVVGRVVFGGHSLGGEGVDGGEQEVGAVLDVRPAGELGRGVAAPVHAGDEDHPCRGQLRQVLGVVAGAGGHPHRAQAEAPGLGLDHRLDPLVEPYRVGDAVAAVGHLYPVPCRG